MTARKRFTRGARGPRRMTSWISGAAFAGAAITSADTVREITLFVPLEDHEGATVIRIVGSVGIWSTVDSALNSVDVFTWGIYLAGSGSQGDLKLDPASLLDRDSEHWLHMRYVYWNKNHNASDFTYPGYLDNAVDIRVMRKVHEGDGLKLAFNGTLAYNSIANLRILLKHT